MLDTITIVLHNINEETKDIKSETGYSYKNPFNRGLYIRLENIVSKFVERQRKTLINGEVEYYDKEDFKRYSRNSDAYVRKEGMEVFRKGRYEVFCFPSRGKIQSQSSDYRTLYSYNDNNDTMKFIFSIPKYLYGTSIAQFIPQPQSKRFRENPFLIRDFDYQANLMHKRLSEFVMQFFDDLATFLGLNNFFYFDIRDVEISRLDLCYNQYFGSKEMALDYLVAQKKIYHSRVKKNTIIKQDYDTSFAYRHATDGFYFKIYHKGSEFSKNDKESDFKRLLKFNQNYLENNPKLFLVAQHIFRAHFPKEYNNERGDNINNIIDYYKTYVDKLDNQSYIKELEELLPFKLSELVKESNKILRYEMSFTRTYMSTLYKKKVFRKKCPHWKMIKGQYNKVQKYYRYLEKSKSLAENYKRANVITREFYHNKKVYDSSINKKHEFYLITDKKIRNHELVTSTIQNVEISRNSTRYEFFEIKQATLGVDLFNLLYQKFKEEIDFFQIKEVEETKTTIELIEIYNRNVENKVNQYVKAFGKDSLKKMKHTEKRKKGYSKLNLSRLKITLDKMNLGKSFKEVVEELGLKKSAEYTLKEDLEKFNIHKNSVKTKYSFRDIRTDFLDYYKRFNPVEQYHKKIFHNPIFISFDTFREDFHKNNPDFIQKVV